MLRCTKIITSNLFNTVRALTHLHFTDKNLPPGDQIDIEGEMARLEAQQEARRKVS